MIGVRHEKYGSSINELPFSIGLNLERTRYFFSKEQNWHENLEIQFFTEGSGTVLLNGEQYPVQKGDIVVVNSNVLHYTFTDSRLIYTCLIISNEWCKQMHIDYHSLCFSSVLKSETIQSMILDLVSVFTNTDDNLRTAKLNERLLSIMIELTENHCCAKTSASPQDKAIETVTEALVFIHDNYQRKITLPEIAKAVLFDKYALCREFKKHTGQTVFSYINHYRTVKARDYLAQGYTVSETASLCGFENLSFFTKMFKRYTGKTPSQYKRK